MPFGVREGVPVVVCTICTMYLQYRRPWSKCTHSRLCYEIGFVQREPFAHTQHREQKRSMLIDSPEA